MRMSLLLLLLLAQCATRAIYTGPIQPVAGVCEATAFGTLTLRAKNVEFAPTSGVVVLVGFLGQDGAIQANFVRPGSDKRPYRLTLQAKLTAGHVEGDYVTPRCHYRVHLFVN